MSYKTKPGYIDNLLILRGLCSLGVLVVHSMGLIPGFVLRDIVSQDVALANTLWGKFVFNFWPTTGSNFVMIFFAHSGYLMGKIYWTKQYAINKESILKFYFNRILRIVPLFYFSLTVCIFLTNKFHHVVFSPIFVMGDFLFLNNIMSRVINPVTWSLSYEMQDYLICPLFFILFSRKNLKTLVYILLALIVCAAYAYYSRIPQIAILNLGQFTWFFLGGYAVNIIVRYFHEDFKLWGNIFTKITAFFVFFISNIIFFGLTVAEHGVIAQVQLLIATMLTLLLLELPEKVSRERSAKISLKICFLRFLTWMGLISYGVYLWHMPIIQSNIEPKYFIEGLASLSDRIGFIQKGVFVNFFFICAIMIQTITLSFVTFFLIELRFRPSLYNFNNSLILFPAKKKMTNFIKNIIGWKAS